MSQHSEVRVYSRAIVPTLSFANDPRAKFTHNIFIGLIIYCITAGVHISDYGKRDLTGDTSSTAAVSTIIFLFNQFLINIFRAVYHCV